MQTLLSILPLFIIYICFLTRLNQSHSLIWLIFSLLFDSISLLWIDCSSFHLPMEGGENRSQLYYLEYYWVGPDLMWNTRGWYIILFLLVVVMLTPPGHNHYGVIYYWLNFACSLLLCIFPLFSVQYKYVIDTKRLFLQDEAIQKPQ